MATKEDILEQLVEEYLSHKGYFIRHNIKYLPDKNHPDFIVKQDSNHSDIDVLAFNPNIEGPERVLAVSCKSWQSGFNPKSKLEEIKKNKIVSGREAWKSFRELTREKWSEAFISAVIDHTGAPCFTYVLAVAKVNGDKSIWENEPTFISALGGNPIKIITFRDMLEDISKELNTTLASTEIGRMLQMFKTSGIKI